MARVRTGALVALLLVTVGAPTASAQGRWRSSGAVTAHGLLYEPASNDPAYGAGALADLWVPFGVWRVGGAIGLAALSSQDAKVSRTFLPVGLSLAMVWRPRSVGLDLRARAGAWAGAIGNGLAAGGWVAGGAYIEYAPDEHVALVAGSDVWFLFGHGDAYVVAPGIGLVWTLDAR